MVRAVALALTVLTGFSGLVYEVAWQKYLAVLLGSHSEATAAVLGIFLGGLAYGYFLFGKLSRAEMARAASADESPRLLLGYGIVEAAIGVYALAFPLFFYAAQWLSLALPHSASAPALSFVFDVGLTALLIGPPTVLMGGTIPLLTQALASDLEDATRFHSLVYALNTLGAFAGAVAAAFVLIPSLGLVGCLIAMGTLNLCAGGIFIALSRRRQGAWVEAPRAAEPDTSELPGLLVCTVVALLAGFAMMSLQTVMNRVGGLALGASHFTFAMVVATFVLCIALGSFAVSALPKVRQSFLPVSQWLLVAYLLLLYPLVQDATYWAHALRMSFGRELADFLPFHAAVFCGILLVFAVPLALSGALLPLLFHDLRRAHGDLGSVAGRLYSWNTVGSLLGALLGGYALLFWLDLHHIYRLAVLALALAASLLSFRILREARLRVAVVAALGLAGLALVTADAWAPERMSAGLFRVREPLPATFSGPETFFAKQFESQDPIVFYDDDPTATITVMQRASDSFSILTNGKSDGNIPIDNLTTGLISLMPVLFADKAERAFVIGYGTGMSVGELTALESMVEVEVAEISPAVIDAAPIFEGINRGASRHPKTTMVRSDAYRALLRTDVEYDVIVSEPSNPWMVGSEMLFSVEFLQAARSRLAPGGVYAQWFQLYETDEEAIELVLRSYREAFSRVAVWYGAEADLILLGFADEEPALSLDELEQRFEKPDMRAQLAAIGITSLPRLLGHEVLPLGVVSHMDLSGELHTILHPRLAHHAARAFFPGRHGRLPPSSGSEAAEVGRESSLVGRFARERFGGELPDAFRLELLREVCDLSLRRCATLWAHWLAQSPHSPVLAERLARARQDPALAAELDPLTLARLAALYRAEGTRTLEPSYTAARALAEVYTDQYEHAAPFDREALLSAWRRCLDPRCAEGLRGLGGAGPTASAASGPADRSRHASTP